MVEIAARLDGVLGSRMTGGGFGGSTINIVRTAAIEEFRHSVAKEYKLATQVAPDIYVSKAGHGITEVDASV
jgi:galactokinase